MTNIVNEVTIQLPIVLTDNEAAQIADKMLYKAWTERDQYEIRLSMKYAYLNSGDVIQVTADGNIHVMRIQSIDMSLPGVLVVKGVADRASLYTSNAIGGSSNYPVQSVGTYGNTVFAIMDIPSLRDSDNSSPGIYVACYGEKDNWNGGALYRSADGGATWDVIAVMTTEATMGTTGTVLGNHEGNDWDDVNTLTVYLKNGTLSSNTEINVLNNSNNIAAVGYGENWEIIGFQTATLEGDGSYTISHLMRGRRGTDHQKSNHGSGELFVLLEDTTIARIPESYANFGNTYKFKSVSNGQSLQDILTDQDLIIDDANTKPFSVVQINGSRDGSNNLTINWQRRSRTTAQMLWTPALGEESEAYEIDVMSGSTVARTITATTNTCSYSAANQTTDGFTPGDPITVKIYQMSATIGRGYEAEETL